MSDINNVQKISKISDLLGVKDGEVVELPPFSESVPFVARIVRPSMMQMAADKQIPNELLAVAEEMFMGKKQADPKRRNTIDDNAMKQMAEVMMNVADKALLEPTYNELKENGISLTDDQLTFLYNYCQEGVSFLRRFRLQQANVKRNLDEQNVGKNTK